MINFAGNQVFSNILTVGVEKYLQNKSFLTKNEVKKLIDKSNAKNKSGNQDLQDLWKTAYFYIVVKLKSRTVAKIITSPMSLQDFLRSGFVSYIFRSKFFWGFDAVLWSLQKYKVSVYMLYPTSNENENTVVVLHNSKGPVRVLTYKRYKQLRFLYNRLFSVKFFKGRIE